MIEEEKEAIEYIEDEVYSIEGLEIQEITFYSKGVEDIKTILNLIQKQQKEIKLLKEQKQYVIDEYGETIEQKDKQIDEMAKMIEKLLNNVDTEKEIVINKEQNSDCIKQYFERKVKYENTKDNK